MEVTKYEKLCPIGQKMDWAHVLSYENEIAIPIVTQID